MTQPAVTVPAGPTSCARRRLAREGSAYPARRGVHTLHTVSLFRPSPKVAMNRYSPKRTQIGVFFIHIGVLGLIACVFTRVSQLFVELRNFTYLCSVDPNIPLAGGAVP